MSGCHWASEMMAKKVSVPLDEPARARLCGAGDRWHAGYVSSGSEHEADSECLAGLVHGFMEGDDDVGRWDDEESTEVCADLDFSDGDASVDLEELLRPRGGDALGEKIAGVVSDAVAGAAGIAGGRPALRRSVMVRLREAGLNAGICKVMWDKAGGLAAGSYEYIDVLLAGDGDHEQQRYVVDVDFVGEFEIARPTRQYDMILAALPRVLVSRRGEGAAPSPVAEEPIHAGQMVRPLPEDHQPGLFRLARRRLLHRREAPTRPRIRLREMPPGDAVQARPRRRCRSQGRALLIPRPRHHRPIARLDLRAQVRDRVRAARRRVFDVIRTQSARLTWPAIS